MQQLCFASVQVLINIMIKLIDKKFKIIDESVVASKKCENN